MDREEIRTQLKMFICKELLQDEQFPLTDEEPLISGGIIDSFSLAQIGVFVENTFGIYIPDDDFSIENLDSVEKMVATIYQAIEKNKEKA